MRDFEKVMLAVYKATVESSKPFAGFKELLAEAGVPKESQVGMTLQQRGFLDDRCPVGSVALSSSGIAYVEERLLG